MSETAPSTVLVVEDYPPLARAITRTLSFDGARVIVVDCARAARTILTETAVDALVTEAVLVDGSGPELASLVRAANPDARLVILTSGPFDLSTLADDAARVTVLAKPLAATQLVGALWPKRSP